MDKINKIVDRVKTKYHGLSNKHQRYVQVVGGFIVLCIIITIVG